MLDLELFYGVSLAAFVWIIIALVASIAGGIVTYFVVFTKENDKRGRGFIKFVYNFFTFKKTVAEPIVRIFYLIGASFITLSSFAWLIYGGFGVLYFFEYLVLGNIALRFGCEIVLKFIKLCDNTQEINDKLGTKKESKKEDK